jgi:hypothetical protein
VKKNLGENFVSLLLYILANMPVRCNEILLYGHLDHLWLEDYFKDRIMCLYSLCNWTLYYVLSHATLTCIVIDYENTHNLIHFLRITRYNIDAHNTNAHSPVQTHAHKPTSMSTSEKLSRHALRFTESP